MTVFQHLEPEKGKFMREMADSNFRRSCKKNGFKICGLKETLVQKLRESLIEHGVTQLK
jgi:hypothetical protein